MKKSAEDGLSKLDFVGADDFRERLEWIRNRADGAQGEDEFRDLGVLVVQTIDEARPLIEEHERKRAEMDRVRADEEAKERSRMEREEEERLRRERAREDYTELTKQSEIRRMALRTMSYNTISGIANQIGAQIPEPLKTAYLARSYGEAQWYVQAARFWFSAGGDPGSFLYFLQTDPYFIQRVHADYGQKQQ